MRALAILTLFASGCFDPSFHNGQTMCDVQMRCPNGYYCAADNACWKMGSAPDLGANASDMSTDDLGSGSDMGPIAFSLTGATTVYELDALSVTISATTSATASTLSLSATGLPTGATFAPNGASATLTWTPTYTQAGSYTVSVTAQSADQSVMSTYMLPLTIKNHVDPVFNPDGSQPSAVALGDFDGDGFGDLAVCEHGSSTSYSIRILYGDATGMPTAMPYPLQRTKLYTIAVGTNNTAGTGTLYCRGVDFDGDAKADVVLADPFANLSGAPANTGRMFIAFGAARIVDTLATSELPVPAPIGQELAGMFGRFGVLNFNGDAYSDVATTVSDGRYLVWPGGSRTASITPIGRRHLDWQQCHDKCWYPTLRVLWKQQWTDGVDARQHRRLHRTHVNRRQSFDGRPPHLRAWVRRGRITHRRARRYARSTARCHRRHRADSERDPNPDRANRGYERCCGARRICRYQR